MNHDEIVSLECTLKVALDAIISLRNGAADARYVSDTAIIEIAFSRAKLLDLRCEMDVHREIVFDKFDEFVAAVKNNYIEEF